MNAIDWKILRIRAGLTQYEAGQIIGAPPYTISKLETGRDQRIAPEKLDRLRTELARLASRAA